MEKKNDNENMKLVFVVYSDVTKGYQWGDDDDDGGDDDEIHEMYFCWLQ